jgi:hypothetical protein
VSPFIYCYAECHYAECRHANCRGATHAETYKWIEGLTLILMEQRIFKNVNNCYNTNIYSCLETSGGKSLNLYLNVIHFFNTSVN